MKFIECFGRNAEDRILIPLKIVDEIRIDEEDGSEMAVVTYDMGETRYEPVNGTVAKSIVKI